MLALATREVRSACQDMHWESHQRRRSLAASRTGGQELEPHHHGGEDGGQVLCGVDGHHIHILHQLHPKLAAVKLHPAIIEFLSHASCSIGIMHR